MFSSSAQTEIDTIEWSGLLAQVVRTGINPGANGSVNRWNSPQRLLSDRRLGASA